MLGIQSGLDDGGHEPPKGTSTEHGGGSREELHSLVINDLLTRLEYYEKEFDLTETEAIGCLEGAKLLIWSEIHERWRDDQPEQAGD
jgi:hypothetical protein